MSFAVGALLMMCWTTPSMANVLYEYTGNPFDFFSGDPYYEGHFVSVSLTMASLLPPNLDEADIAAYVLDFSFNDGMQTITKADPRTDRRATGATFIASTDASSSITRWKISAEIYVPPATAGAPQLFSIETFTIPNSGTDDFWDSGRYAFGNYQFTSGTVYNNPGTWTIVVPEPSTLVLSILGMSIVAAARRLHHK